MKSTKMVAGDEPHDEDLELQRMTTTDQLEDIALDVTVPVHRLNKTSCWSHAFSKIKMRTFLAVLLISITVCGSLLAVISYRARRSDKSISTKEESGTPKLGHWNKEKKPIMDNEKSEEETIEQFDTLDDNDNNERIGDRLPQLRSYVEDEKPYPPERVGHMNIYIRKDGHRGSRLSYKRLRFPIAKYNRRRMPFVKPFISFMPRIPIFAHRLSKQTIIYSQTGGVYIIPPVINMYGQIFSIAELIASGYASLVSSGVQPNGPINMVPFFQSIPLIGPNIPMINPLGGGFTGGIRTNFGKFSIRRYYDTSANNNYAYDTEEEEEEDEYEDNYRPVPRPPKNYKRLPKKYTRASNIYLL